MRRQLRSLLACFGALVVASVVAVLIPGETSAAPPFTSADVVDEFVAGGNWTSSVGGEFMPDGRLLVITTTGTIYLVNPATGSSSTYFTIPGVLSTGEAGLLDIAVDPAFATNGYFYTYSSELSTRRLRVDRFTFSASGATSLASRTQIWVNPGPPMNEFDYHIGGSLNFGPDGMLYLTTGENLFSSNSQDMTTVFGKVLRFRSDGTVPATNPFYDGAGPNIDEIWAIGLRNGFRSSFDSATGDYWLGDVGGNNATTAYEEINLIEVGRNYGWPACEGPLGQPKNGADCPSGITGPLYSYSHDVTGGCCQNRAVVGGEVYRGTSFPSSFVGTYVYADYPTGTFYWLERNGASVSSGELKKTSLTNGVPVWVAVSPVDGNIYWMHYGFGNGQLRRLRYNGALAHAPTITTNTATPTSGASPLTVNFTAAATDLDGDSIAYHWEFGDGTSANSATPTKQYTTNGSYTAQVTVTANGDTVTGSPITIQVGAPPVATITSPPSPSTFRAGDTIVINGSATDPDDGPLSGSALSWNIVFLHDDHIHPVTSGTGPTITLPVPQSQGHSWEGQTGYRVTLTATDSDGLTATSELLLNPIKTNIDITANVPAAIEIDGITEPLPAVLDTAVGAQHTITAPAEVCVSGVLQTFSAWSSGAPRTHTLTAVVNHPALVATYTPGGSCGPTLYRAVNINGGALTIDGVPFEDGRTAPDFASGPVQFCDDTVPLVPATSAEETEMIRCSSYGVGNALTTMSNVPNGSYTVEFWVWEDNNSETFTPTVNGAVQPAIVSGGAGAWRKVGPLPVSVTANQIVVSATGGAANFSGIRVNYATPQGDTVAPTVASVSPLNGATGVATSATAAVTFSEPVSPNSGVTLAVDGGASVPTTVSVAGNVVTLTPTAPLVASTRYRVSVSTAVADLAGNPLASASSTTFTTVAAPPTDTTAPTITGVTPANGATGVSPSAPVTVTFSEPVTANGGVSLAVDGGSVVASTLAVSGSTVTLTPSGPLAAGVTYRVTVSAAVRDLAGNSLAAGSSTTFTTGAAPANTELKVSRSSTRASAVPLAGNTWAPGEDVYVFLDVSTPAVGVRFHLDNPVSGPIFHSEGLAPWDFNGGAVTSASPYVNNLPVGPHTISALVTRADGGTDTYTAAFTVGSAPPVDTMAPTVASVSPANGASAVATSTSVTVTFSEPVAPNGGVTLAVDGGAAVAASSSVSGNSVTLTPSAPLAAGTTYRVSVSTAVRDLAGNPVTAPSSTTFATAAAPPVDATPPGILSVTPSDGATGVSTSSTVAVTFSEPVAPNGGVTLAINGGATVATTATVSPTGNIVTLTPSAPLAAGTTYRISVSTAVRDLAGNALGSASSTTFATVPALPTDTTPPTVTSINPANGATGVATTASATVTFSEPVTLNGGVTLAVDGGSAVAASVSVSGNNVTLTPSALLANGTTYRVSVSSAVRDLAGNAVTTPVAATFTTATPPAGGTELQVARSATRAPAVALNGDNWQPGEQVAVFLDIASPAVGVRFYLDTPVTGSVFHGEGLAPWDFNGGSVATASFYTNNLSVGSHTIRAVATRADGSADTYTATFTVGTTPPPPPPPDTTAPTVTSVSPANGAAAVPTTASVAVTFSEPVAPNAGVTLAVNGGAAVPTVVTVSGNTVTLVPVAPLAPATTYRVAVSTAVRDTAGNALASASATTFTTATVAAPSELKVARNAARSPAVALGGDTWVRSEQVYVFLDVATPAVSVRFYLDTPTSGTPFRVEGTAPWDFGGGSVTSAYSYTVTLSPGQHTISAVLTQPGGTTQTYTAVVTVV